MVTDPDRVAEIALWALVDLWGGCLPDAGTAFWIFGITYATIGCGGAVVAKPWRMLGLVEGWTGILMCGYCPLAPSSRS